MPRHEAKYVVAATISPLRPHRLHYVSIALRESIKWSLIIKYGIIMAVLLSFI